MPIRTIITLVVAALLGLAAVFLTRSYLGRQQTAEVADVNAGTTTVVVASQPIGRGVALTPSVLKVAHFPKEYVPVGSFATVQEATAGGVRRALRPISANEPILPDRVTGAGGRANLSATMTPGMRAVTFRSNDVAGVAGFVLPGDRVDILLTREISDDNPVTDVLLQNVRVLGIDQLADEQRDQPLLVKAVTLEVTTEQAQKLTLASTVGTLGLALRGVAYVATERVKRHARDRVTRVRGGLSSCKRRVYATAPSAPTNSA